MSLRDVRFGSKADMCSAKRHIRFCLETFTGCDHVGDVKSRPRHLLDANSLTILPHIAASRRPRSGRNRMFQSTLRCGALGCVLAFAFASVAGAQLLSHRDLSASMAITIAQTTIETCK